MRKTWLVVMILGACGGDDGGSTPMPDAAENVFKPLIMSSWTLQPGTEIYQCATLTVPRDMFIAELRPLIPLGTHHTVVSVAPSATRPDNPGYTCSNPFEFGGPYIYGSGVGSIPFVFPEGIGLRLRAGQQLHINLHLYNAGDSVLTGTSGIEVREVMSVMHEAGSDIWGPLTLTIDPGTNVETGSCTTLANVNMVSFQPHMHQLGTHLKFTVTPPNAAPIVVFDKPYNFEDQSHIILDPILTVPAGSQVSIECTYNNTTSQTVGFGESSDEEMCVAGIMKYPGNAAFCQQ